MLGADQKGALQGQLDPAESPVTMESVADWEAQERALYTERMLMGLDQPGHSNMEFSEHFHEHVLQERFHHSADAVIAWIVIAVCIGAVFTVLICFTRRCPSDLRQRAIPWTAQRPEDECHLTDHDVELDLQDEL